MCDRLEKTRSLVERTFFIPPLSTYNQSSFCLVQPHKGFVVL